jgi:hypothetical protein
MPKTAPPPRRIADRRRAKSPAQFPSRARARAATGSLATTYLTESEKPLTALLFVLPLVVLYEIGVAWYGTLGNGSIEYRTTAFTLLTQFLHSFGAAGRYLPAMTVVAVLLCTHAARGEPWAFNIPWVPVMAVESLILALPLLGVYFLASPVHPQAAFTGDWKSMACLYLGAGIYEELLFRLVAFSLLSLLLIDLLRVKRMLATPVIVLIAAGVFSAYHMLGSNPLPWQAFVFIGLRGVYYGIIFLERGFGISVGTHTAYDLMFLAL